MFAHANHPRHYGGAGPDVVSRASLALVAEFIDTDAVSNDRQHAVNFDRDGAIFITARSPSASASSSGFNSGRKPGRVKGPRADWEGCQNQALRMSGWYSPRRAMPLHMAR